MKIRRYRISRQAAFHICNDHGVEPWEAFEVLQGNGSPIRARDAKGEKRYYIDGYTEAGRYLRVIFAAEAKDAGLARISHGVPGALNMATEKARTRKAVVFPPTEEEEIEFWKRHDIADFAEGPADDIVLALQPERKKQVTIRLEPSLVEDLKETAAGVGVPYQTFARHLIKIGLRKFHRDGYG